MAEGEILSLVSVLGTSFAGLLDVRQSPADALPPRSRNRIHLGLSWTCRFLAATLGTTMLFFLQSQCEVFLLDNTWLQSLRLLSSPMSRTSGWVTLKYSFGAPAASIALTAASPAITRRTSSSSETPVPPNFCRTSGNDKFGGDQFCQSLARGRLRILSLILGP